MIREQLVAGVEYALVHPSAADRSAAARVRVVDTRPHVHLFDGSFTPCDHGQGVLIEHRNPDSPFHGRRDVVRLQLIRSTWEDHVNGIEPTRRQYVHQDIAGWLRRIAASPDASNDLADAALRQLASL